MSARVLVDTNVLVYAYDRSEPERQQRAFEVLDRLSMSNAGVFSTQVFSEFFVAVTRKIATPLPVPDACDRNHQLSPELDHLGDNGYDRSGSCAWGA